MAGGVVVVAVDGSSEITDYALEWALSNVVGAADSVILLALLPSSTRGFVSVNGNSKPSGFQQFFACKSSYCCNIDKQRRSTEIIDPKMEGDYSCKEVESMLHSASLCLLPDPERRPRMSQVLRMLEGDMPNDMAYQPGEPSMPFLEHQRKNSYSPGKRFNNRTHPTSRNYSPSPPIESLHHMKHSTITPRAYKVDRNTMNILPATSSDCYGMERLSNVRSIDQNEECISQEYQTYLQGSLVEFIHNMN